MTTSKMRFGIDAILARGPTTAAAAENCGSGEAAAGVAERKRKRPMAERQPAENKRARKRFGLIIVE